jgi:site-specific recombinase XerD
MSKLKEMLLLVGQFLKDRYPYQSQKLTYKAYRGDINSFLKWLDSDDVQLETVEEGHFTAYAERLRGTLP